MRRTRIPPRPRHEAELLLLALGLPLSNLFVEGCLTQSAAVATPEAVLEDYRLSSAGRRFAEAAEYVRAYPRDLPRLRTLLPNIATPVLVLAGKNDPIVPPANGQLLADHLPHCRHKLLEGGHLIWEDAAETYAASLIAWVSGVHRAV